MKINKSPKIFAKCLRKSCVSKDRKWLYTLVAWCIENKDENMQHINRHVNTIWHHNKGYFDKYRDEKYRRKIALYYKKKYALNKKKYLVRSNKQYERYKTVYAAYNSGALPSNCTKIINAKLDAKINFKVKGRCR